MRCCAAASSGTALALLLLALAGCRGGPPRGAGPSLHTLPAPSAAERYCAWYGDARGDVLYFGAAAFWAAYSEAGQDPTADLRVPGPQLVGRFDLRRRRFLPPLDVTEPGATTGVWDVLAAPGGRVYFTTFFGSAGFVEPATGAVHRFPAAGPGLNELYPGPDGTVLATRYAHPGRRDGGSLVQLDADGRVLAELPLEGPEGFLVAAKSVARDPTSGELWVTTDLLPEAGGPPRHDLRILDPGGRERRRLERPEVQFVSFGDDGTRYAASVEGSRLALEITAPDAGAPRVVLLDDAFDAAHDFVQDLKLAPSGVAVVTRWSGQVHLIGSAGALRSVRLPRGGQGGLYYTAVLADGRLCATLCDEVNVVCLDLPDPPPPGAGAARRRP